MINEINLLMMGVYPVLIYVSIKEYLNELRNLIERASVRPSCVCEDTDED